MRLLKHASTFRNSDVVVLMTSPKSFAHTVLGADTTRRLYPGKRCLFLISSLRLEYNMAVRLLWPDITVVFFPRFMFAVSYKHRVVAIPFITWHDIMAVMVTRIFTRFVAGRKAIFHTLMELYEEMLGTHGHVNSSLEWAKGKSKLSFEITTAIMKLQNSVPSPRIQLPGPIRRDTAKRLLRAWEQFGGTSPPKICCLYIRNEKKESWAQLRNGSDLRSHLPAARLLNKAGYQVLLTGDYDLDQKTREDFRGGLVNAACTGVGNDLYQLFAATEADIFIGNNGGGETFAMVNNTPSLYLNWFPYFCGRRNAWVYFKSARDGKGRILPGRRLITDFVYDIDVSFGTLINNTQEEITDAVACFIEDVTRPDAPDPYAHIAALIPQNTQFHLVGARLSPAWVRRNIPDEIEMESATA
jgi:putative glycosyltransferase (TIGR04372 family)